MHILWARDGVVTRQFLSVYRSACGHCPAESEGTVEEAAVAEGCHIDQPAESEGTVEEAAVAKGCHIDQPAESEGTVEEAAVAKGCHIDQRVQFKRLLWPRVVILTSLWNRWPQQSQEVMAAHLGEQPDTVSVESEGSVSVESEDSMDETVSDQTTHKAAPQPYPPASTTLIELRHHPHSGILEPEFIFWDLPSGNLVSEQDRDSPQQCYNTAKPWAPFHTRADFEFAEIAIQSAMHTDSIKRLIMGIKHNWTDPGHSRLTFQDINDFDNTMGFARKYVVPFQKDSITATYEGIEYTFDFQFRDPWKWIRDLVTDPSLSSSLILYPVKKFLHANGRITQIFDEINTGQTWWDIQIVDPGDPDDRTQKEKVAFGCFKQDIYHKILRKMLRSLEHISHEGIAIQSWKRQHVLVERRQLRLIIHALAPFSDQVIHPSDYQTMQSVYKQAINAHTKAASEEILKKNGLHKVLNTFWFIANSDPYIAHSYDLLHNDDSGKFGKHLFPLTIEVLGDLAKKGKYSQNISMNMVPSWPNLNHFQSITTMEFSDGQSYFEALKNVEEQMTRIDENQEAIARIRMAIDAYEKELKDRNAEAEEEKKAQHNTQAAQPQGHWKLGSPEKHTTSMKLEESNKGNMVFQNFHKNLLGFLWHIFPEDNLDSMPMKV
ncbi:hypothetical protein JB92DRAFT_2827152 [Gautieria morchelliformis]|nr:hypothetical protein JB92DRAFT_2827152 [Gautieria morchelliformis]